MIRSVKLVNFRNFSKKEVSFSEGVSLIIAKNGSGKTNILEAISYPSAKLNEIDPLYMIKAGEDIFYVQVAGSSNTISYSYNRETKKKQFTIGEKNTTKTKLKSVYPHIISFTPQFMNLLYFSPSERRAFLDDILIQAFPEYKTLLSKYKKVIHSRNKLLKNISQEKSSVDELPFWDTQYISLCLKVYEYRYRIIDFLDGQISKLEDCFFGKVEKIVFHYETKTPRENTVEYLQNYIIKNREKEILLRKTLRGPHLDDFSIYTNDIPIVQFGSRGEIKSLLLRIKFLEKYFLKSYSTKQEVVYLVDDILSELDSEHISLVMQEVENAQCIITSISDIDIDAQKIFL